MAFGYTKLQFDLLNFIEKNLVRKFQQTVIRQSSRIRLAVVGQSSGSRQAVVGQSSGSRQAVVGQSSSNRQAVVRHSSTIAQPMRLKALVKLPLFAAGVRREHSSPLRLKILFVC